MSANNLGGPSGGPNWLGLLQWSLAHSDGTAPSAAANMSEDDKEWLTNALKEAVKNEADRLKEIYAAVVKIVEAKHVEDEDAFCNELEELRDIVENLDMAQVFAKFGGVMCLSNLFNIDAVSMEIKTTVASIIGTIAQNNPGVQTIILEQNIVSSLVKVFLRCLQTAQDSAATAVATSVAHFKLAEKLTYAISCSVRSHYPAESAFLAAESGEANTFITAALETQNVPLVRRIFFLCQALLSSDNATLWDVNVLCVPLMPVLLPYFAIDDIQLRESALQLLLAIMQTQIGWDQFGEGQPCHAEFREALGHLQQMVAEDPAGAGRVMAELIEASKSRNIIYPRRTATAAAVPTASDILQRQEEEEEQQQQQPTLMIAPPALDASANIP